MGTADPGACAANDPCILPISLGNADRKNGLLRIVLALIYTEMALLSTMSPKIASNSDSPTGFVRW